MRLATKPETIVRQIGELSKNHSIPLLEFKNGLIDDEDSMLSNAANYLRVLKLFSNHIGSDKDFKDVTRIEVLEFLNKRKNSVEDDPDKKWIRTWNDYLARLIGFYRWLYNQESNKERSEWDTPEPFNSIKKKKNKRYSSYSPNDVWSQEELLLAVKYCDNIRDKAIMTMCWDMAGRNHEIVKIKIKDVILKEKYAEVSTAWDTKTGTRTNPIILGFPYLRELLNNHPFSSEPNAFLMISRTSMKPITPDRLWAIANFLKAGYGKIKFDYPGFDDVVVEPVLKFPRYENATVFNVFESDHFAGFDNTFLGDSTEHMYPENHFWNTVTVTALDKDGNIDGIINLDLTVIPNGTIPGTFDIDEYLYDKIVFNTVDDGFAQIIAGLDFMGNDIVIVNGHEVYPLDNLSIAGNGEIVLEKTRRVLTSFTQYDKVIDQIFGHDDVPDISDKYILDTGDAIMAIPLTTSLQTLNPYELEITADDGAGNVITHTFPHPWYEFSIDYDYTLNMATDNTLDIKQDPANPRVLFYKYNESFGTITTLSINGIDMTPELPNCFSVKSTGSCTMLVPESEYLAELDIEADNMWGGIASAILIEIDQLEPVIPDPLDVIFGLHVYDWILVLIVILIMAVLIYKVLKKFLLTNY